MSFVLTADEVKKLRARILKSHDLLQLKYGAALSCPTQLDPLDDLILRILSQNNTQTRSQESFERLKKKFRSWDRLMNATLDEVTSAIQSGGLNRVKALRIRRILKKIHSDCGSLKLDYIKKMNAKEVMDYFISLKGVGSRTASSVALHSLNKSVMPVNTPIIRVAKRLGWIWSQAHEQEAQEILNRVIPQYILSSLHALLVQHGRVLCKVNNPRCISCPLKHDCDFCKVKVK